jgi:hypothetical protein
MTGIQARIIDALSPVWKGILMERLYHIVWWKIRTPLQILEPRRGTIYTDVISGEETIVYEPHDEGENMLLWDEMEEENLEAEKDIEKAKKTPDSFKIG